MVRINSGTLSQECTPLYWLRIRNGAAPKSAFLDMMRDVGSVAIKDANAISLHAPQLAEFVPFVVSLLKFDWMNSGNVTTSASGGENQVGHGESSTSPKVAGCRLANSTNHRSQTIAQRASMKCSMLSKQCSCVRH